MKRRETRSRTTHDPGLRIFVCYRREDSAGFARALKTVLGERYGKDQVFMDLDNIAPGQLWEDVVDRAVSHCDVLIALIGPHWLTLEDGDGQRRLTNPVDPVRLEIEAALRERLVVIPTLLQGAHVPPRDELPVAIKSLPAIQALAITDDWDAGVAKLVTTLDGIDDQVAGIRRDAGEERTDESPPSRRVASPPRPPVSKQPHAVRSLVIGIVIAALAFGGVALAVRHHGSPPTPDPHTSALHDYLWTAHDLVETSGHQLTQVRAAIRSGNAETLRQLQEDRSTLLATVERWDVPPATREATLALEEALRYTVISDGNWASVAEHTFSSPDATSYDMETVDPAKLEFDRLYDRLLIGVDDAPPPLPTDTVIW